MIVALNAQGFAADAFSAFSAAIKPPANTQHETTKTSKTRRAFIPCSPFAFVDESGSGDPVRRGGSGYTGMGGFPAEFSAASASQERPERRDRNAAGQGPYGLPP